MAALRGILAIASAAFAAAAGGADNGAAARADYPTAARVEFVLDCMEGRDASRYELVNKCSCAIDQLALRYDYDALVEAQTMANGVTIAGDRGAALRDNAAARAEAKSYRQAVADAERACFLQPRAQ